MNACRKTSFPASEQVVYQIAALCQSIFSKNRRRNGKTPAERLQRVRGKRKPAYDERAHEGAGTARGGRRRKARVGAARGGQGRTRGQGPRATFAAGACGPGYEKRVWSNRARLRSPPLCWREFQNFQKRGLARAETFQYYISSPMRTWLSW